MKRTLLVLLVLSVNLAAQSYSGGAGTSGDPYQIANKADLKYLSEHTAEWSKHFNMTADITFETADFESGGDFYNGGLGFIPIGLNSTFSGTFDGDGHSISNVYINRSSTTYVGFFSGSYDQYGNNSITNLNLVNVNIRGANSTGGLVGLVHYGTF